MGCNCINNNTTHQCTQCSAGLTCNCPPDYSVAAQPVPCPSTCCPPGYWFAGVEPTLFPNGFCCPTGGPHITCSVQQAVSTIPCNTCTDSVPASCVFVSNIPCLGVSQGTVPLNQVLSYLCSEAFILSQLQTIGLSATLKAALCEIISICPSTGNTTPIPGPITVTIP